MSPPFHTTVERSAEYSVEICASSKCRSWPNPHHVLVVRHPLVEPALLDVADHMIDDGETNGRLDQPAGKPRAHETWAVVAVVVTAIDERVLCLAVGCNR